MRIFPKGHGSFIKILSLTIGLTLGLVLIAKVQLEENFDACIKDKQNVYRVYSYCQREGGNPEEYQSTSGGVVPKMREYIPEIVSGTRYTGHASRENILLEDNRKVAFEECFLADSCFFDIFDTEIIIGNAREVLSTPGLCLVSKRMYEKLGAGAIGKTFTFISSPQKPIEIAGVFDTFNENTTIGSVDIIISLPSIGFFSYDGTSNMLGNDRYRSYLRFRPGTDMKKVKAESERMTRELLPWEDLRAGGYLDIDYRMASMVGAHQKEPGVKETCAILSIVAFVMLFAAVMNYILVVISTLIGRARQVAVRKCLGATASEFYLSTTKEAAAHISISLLLMCALLFAGQDVIKDLLGVSVTTLFSTQTIVVTTIVGITILLCCGLLPGYLYSRIPLVYAYRLYSESKKVWKLTLLAFQLLLSGLLLSVLLVTSLQYNYLLNKDMGYEYKDVAYVSINIEDEETYSLAKEIEKLPCVKNATLSYSLFIERQNGDNVRVSENPRDLFNCANLFFASYDIVETMGLQLVKGKGFSKFEKAGWTTEVLVDERFEEKIKEVLGWDDILGRYIINATCGDEYPVKIVGVVKNFTIQSLVNPEKRPMMVINGNTFAHYILVRFCELNAENIMKVQEVCNRHHPKEDLTVKAYANELAGEYVEILRTKNLITIGCVATLLIMLIGLIGYITDEVQRRSKELAIRKMLGASVKELQGLFLANIAKIAVPAIVIGTAVGYYLSTILLQQFPEKITLSWWIFALSALMIFILVLTVAIAYTYKLMQKNPVESIKTD